MNFKILFFLILTSCLHAQLFKESDTLSTAYLLTDIVISGTNKYTKNQILNFTSLKLNEPIDVSPQKMSLVIKKLWKTKLFSDVAIFQHAIEGTSLILRINIIPLSDLGKVNIKGIPIRIIEKFKKTLGIKDGIKATENLKNNLTKHIINFYQKKGFSDTKLKFTETTNTENPSQIDWDIFVDIGHRVKITSITFEGNNNLNSKYLRSKLKNIKKTNFFRFWESSKFSPEKFQDDLNSIINEYQSLGFRDATVVSYSIDSVNKKNYDINIQIEEGKRYYLGNIQFIGNTDYSNELLSRIFNYKKGDAYDKMRISKKISGSEKDDDISTLYTNNGYLFSNINLIEKSVRNDTIDIDIIINEGTQATWNKVSFSGNHNTYDHVIQRSLRTLPGELFSKEDIKRTYFDLASMPYIEVQQIKQKVVPNPQSNTVDIHWYLTEKGASQIQLQGGYGSGKFIGTLGLSFGNFSLRNLFTKNKWKPIPLGEGQTLSSEFQVGGNFQNYSITFVEPWIGGKNPTSLSISGYSTILKHATKKLNDISQLNTFGVSLGSTKLLSWPDNWFRVSHTIAFQIYKFHNYPFNFGAIQLDNASSNNLSYTIALSRNSKGSDPIFPTYGSEFDVSLKLTPPYSLMSNKLSFNTIDNKYYKWIEYYKIKMKAYWYQELIEKSVLCIGSEFGILQGYDSKSSIPPFDRFFLGGTGLHGSRFDGREMISLRGYQNTTSTGGAVGQDITPRGGGTIYNKFIMDIRYPISMGQAAKIYGLAFLETGNTWKNGKKYQPFKLKRAAGVGIRIFMNALGLFGLDLGYGFDNPINSNQRSGWKTHFIFGQQF